MLNWNRQGEKPLKAKEQKKTLNIAAVDDTDADREILKEMLNRYVNERGQHETEALCFCLEEFGSGEEFLETFHPGKYDIIFFDIYMKELTGMDTAKEVYRRDKQCRLIFFTSSFDYAIEGYSVHAAWYLLKPLKYDQLCLALNGFIRTASRDTAYLLLTFKGGLRTPVLMRDILYVDCVRRTGRIHMEKGMSEVTDKFTEIADRLEQDARFLCCNRGIYVNMDWIRELKAQDVILKNGERLPVRIHGRGEIKQKYLSYTLENLREGT